MDSKKKRTKETCLNIQKNYRKQLNHKKIKI